MTQLLEQNVPKTPPTYFSLVKNELRMWNEARTASRYPNSLFIKIPKNAGTSVYQMLRAHGLVKLKTTRAVRLWFRNTGRICFDHMSIGSLMEAGLVDRDFVASSFKFVIVRDPYERALSLYRYLSGYSYLNWHKWPTFTEFLERIAAGHYERIGPYNDRGLSQANPQVEWLRDVTPDKIYKVEDLDEFASDIARQWDIPRLPIPHANRSGGAQVQIDRPEQRLIERAYAEDFDFLGYPRR